MTTKLGIERLNDNLISDSQLMDILKFKRRGDLERHLRKLSIPILCGRGGAFCTTLSAINEHLKIEQVRFRSERRFKDATT